MNKKGYCLRRIDLYSGISHEEFVKVADEAFDSYIPAEEILYEEGESGENSDFGSGVIFVLKEGEVELYKTDRSGKKIVLETLFPGDVFGNFGTEKYTNSARTTRRSYICQTPIYEFLKLIKEYPQMVFQIMKIMAQRTEEYENKIAVLSSSAKNQLFHEIKNLYQKNKQRFLQKILDVPFKISHQKLSEKTGLNRVTVTKLMKELQEERKIFVDEGSREIRVL